MPAKIKGKPSQQLVSLGLYFNAAGIQSAERKAQKCDAKHLTVAKQRHWTLMRPRELGLNEFRWENWLVNSTSYGTCGYWIKEFETDYFNRKSRTEQTETTWDTDYKHIFKRLNADADLTEDSLIELVFTTEPDTRQRKRAVRGHSPASRREARHSLRRRQTHPLGALGAIAPLRVRAA